MDRSLGPRFHQHFICNTYSLIFSRIRKQGEISCELAFQKHWPSAAFVVGGNSMWNASYLHSTKITSISHWISPQQQQIHIVYVCWGEKVREIPVIYIIISLSSQSRLERGARRRVCNTLLYSICVLIWESEKKIWNLRAPRPQSAKMCSAHYISYLKTTI